MSRSMVTGLGHSTPIVPQKRLRSGNIFRGPRLGCLLRNRLISSRIRGSHVRRRLVLLGARDFGLRNSSFPLPDFSRAFQSRSVRKESAYASLVAPKPGCAQNVNIFARFCASSVIIYRKRIPRSHNVREPFTPRQMLNILMFCHKQECRMYVRLDTNQYKVGPCTDVI